MKSKYIFLSTLVSAGIMSVTCYAENGYQDRPSGGVQKCYPGKPGCPTAPGKGEYGYGNGAREYGYGNGKEAYQSKKLQMQSAEKFKGTVESVNRERYPDGRLFIQITLKTDRGISTILVGPASYIDQSKVKLQTGDRITVTGFRVSANGEETIIAKEIDKNGNILRLLDDQRQPLWSNSRNGNGNGNGRNNTNSNYWQ